MQRLTFPFPFVHHQSHVYQQPRPSGTTINRGNEDWMAAGQIRGAHLWLGAHIKEQPLIYQLPANNISEDNWLVRRNKH